MLPSSTAFLLFDCLLLANSKTKHLFQDKNILNIGQYSNSFNLIRFLFALAGKFRKEINDIPIYITLNLNGPDSIAIFLSFLSLGIKNIKINSDMPNYITTALIATFKDKYGVDRILRLKDDIRKFFSI